MYIWLMVVVLFFYFLFTDTREPCILGLGALFCLF